MLGEQYAHSGAWVVTVRGDLDLDSIAGHRTRLTRTAAAFPVLVLDMAAVTFADSTFLNLILILRRTTDLRLANVPDLVMRLLELTGADAVLQLYPTVADALPADTPASP
ncbi:STAS domain-containing protein [Streptomyces sp. NPDC048484]|uniref:STAS domain-containing protein n=1 Tax=Streptomyces sp. NPDC048484 TaxID=3155146 RepID=UPI00341529D0